jgi:parallel beta-helix repeat protein
MRNQCVGNLCCGIEFRSASGTAENNICRFNHINGIAASDPNTNVILTANTCSDNYPSGIFFEKGAVGKVSGNICQNNPFSGISVRGSGTNPIIANNNLSNNGAWGLRIWGGAQPGIDPNNIFQGNTKAAAKID